VHDPQIASSVGAFYHTLTFVGSIKSSIQRPGIEPGTSAVLKPRHNQLDHLCARDVIGEIQNSTISATGNTPRNAPWQLLYLQSISGRFIICSNLLDHH
jgi:hypothetical protein